MNCWLTSWRLLRLALALLGATSCESEVGHEKIYRSQSAIYDAVTNQQPVRTHSAIDQLFADFEKVGAKEKDTAQFFRHIKTSPNPELVRYSYYKVTGPDIYRYVLDKHRLYEFLPKDEAFYQNLLEPDSGHPVYFRLKAATFHLVLDFLLQLEAKNLDTESIVVRYGYRHPMYNLEIGGALKSQHIYGTAIDLRIGDLDRSGVADSTDKAIASELLESLVGNKGGFGNYPGTQALHVDTRGYRARWQSYTPGKNRLQGK